MPNEWWRWELARGFGWSLEYVDALKLADLHEYLQIRDGESKTSTSLLRKR